MLTIETKCLRSSFISILSKYPRIVNDHIYIYVYTYIVGGRTGYRSIEEIRRDGKLERTV